MSIKFSQFTIETSPTSVSYLVGYYGGINVQITPNALLAGHIPYSGATADVFLGTHTIQSAAFKIPGGTNEQFLKADGSLDPNIYLTQNDLPTTLLLFSTNAPSGINGYFKLVNTIDNPDYNTVPVDIPTGNIILEDQFIAGLITAPNQISGNPGVFNITTIGSIRKAVGSGSGEATFFYRIYKRDEFSNETLVCTSDATLPVSNGTYSEFQAAGIFNDGIFGPTDYIVVKYYANRIPGGSDPAYEFRFGGDTPVRTVFPIPTSAIPSIFLNDIADVYIDPMTLTNSNTLVYDAMSQLWKNGAGGGGGGLGTLDITTIGTIGQDINVSYNITSTVSGSTNGTQIVPINLIPSISVYTMSMTPDLQSIAFTNLIAVDDFNISGYNALSSVSFSALTTAYQINIPNALGLTSLSFPSLTNISGFIDFSSYNPYLLSTAYFPVLASAKFQFYGSYVGINQIDSFYFPALTSFSCEIQSQNISTIDLPTVTTFRNNENFTINTYNTTLTSVVFTGLVDIKSSSINISVNSGLFDIVLGVSGILKSCKDFTSINLTDNAITDSDKIDDILVAFASLDGTNGTTYSYSGYLYLQGGTNAAPTLVGQNAITTLLNRGWQVTTNP